MNHGWGETEKFFSSLQELSLGFSHAMKSQMESGLLRACVIPPMLSLVKATSQVQKLSFPMIIGAQNAHWEKKGAFTGEISGPMLQEQGISWALVGHSERRQYFGETDKTVRLRAESLLNQGFHVILCVGETRQEREGHQTETVLTRQIQEALGHSDSSMTSFMNGKLIIAYEPVWAIGTGLTATPPQAEEAHHFIRKLIRNLLGAEAAERTPILYGGSVTPENIESLLACPNVDGALVGGASLKPESYLALLQAGAQAISE